MASSPSKLWAILAIIMTLLVVSNQAAIITFTNQLSSDLSLATSYNPRILPTELDDVVIPSNQQAALNGNSFSCNSLRILQGATLVITGSTLTFKTGVTVESGATLILQNGAKLYTESTSAIANPANPNSAPSLSFPTISVLGQLTLYPNTTISGKVDSTSLNITPPLVLLIMGGGQLQILPSQSSSEPTTLINLRLVAFESGSFIYGQSARSNRLGTIQALRFNFVLVNINNGGSFIIHSQQNGASISTSDASSTVSSLRPQQIIVDGGEMIIYCDNTSSNGPMDGSDRISTNINIYADIVMKNNASLRALVTDSVDQSTTTTTTTTTTTPSFTKSKSTFFGIITATDSTITVASHIIVEFQSQQADLRSSTMVFLPASTVRIFSGLTSLGDIFYNRPQVNPSGQVIPVFIAPKLELFATVHLTQSVSLDLDVYLYQQGQIALGTSLLTTPLTVDVTVNGSFFFYGGTISSLGTDSSQIRPIRTLRVASAGKFIIDDDLSANGDISTSFQKTLRHTIISVVDAGSLFINSKLSLQDGAQIMAGDQSTINVQPNTVLTSDRALKSSSDYSSLIQQFTTSSDSFTNTSSVDIITTARSSVNFITTNPAAVASPSPNWNSQLDVVMFIKTASIPTPVFNTTTTFLRPFAIQSVSPFNATTPLKIGSVPVATSYSFIIDNSASAFTPEIVSNALPIELKHPYLSFIFKSIGKGEDSASALIIPEDHQWALHSITLLDSQISFKSELTLYGVLQLGSINSQRSIVYGTSSIKTNGVYIYNGDITAKRIEVTSGFHIMLPAAITNLTQTMLTKTLNVESITLLPGSYSIWTSGNVILVSPSIQLSLQGLLSIGLGTSITPTAQPSTSNLTITPTAQLHFDNVASPYITPILDLPTTVSISIINNGLIITNDNAQIDLAGTISSFDTDTHSTASTPGTRSVSTLQLTSSSDQPRSNIILGSKTTLSLAKTQNDGISAKNNIQRIFGADANLVIAEQSTTLSDINVGHVQVTNSDSTSAIFQNGCFAKTPSSYTIFSQPLTQPDPTPSTISVPSSTLTPVDNTTPGPTTQSTPTDPDPITLGPPNHSCPGGNNSTDVLLKWIFFALFVLFFIISIVLGVVIFVMRRNYEKRLKELQSVAIGNEKRRQSFVQGKSDPGSSSSQPDIQPKTGITDDILSPGAKPAAPTKSKPSAQSKQSNPFSARQ